MRYFIEGTLFMLGYLALIAGGFGVLGAFVAYGVLAGLAAIVVWAMAFGGMMAAMNADW